MAGFLRMCDGWKIDRGRKMSRWASNGVCGDGRSEPICFPPSLIRCGYIYGCARMPVDGVIDTKVNRLCRLSDKKGNKRTTGSVRRSGTIILNESGRFKKCGGDITYCQGDDCGRKGQERRACLSN